MKGFTFKYIYILYMLKEKNINQIKNDQDWDF